MRGYATALTTCAAVAALLLPRAVSAQYLPPGSVDFYSSQVGVKLAESEVKLGQIVPATVVKPEKLAALPGGKKLPPVQRGEKLKMRFTGPMAAEILLLGQGKLVTLAFDEEGRTWEVKGVYTADNFLQRPR